MEKPVMIPHIFLRLSLLQRAMPNHFLPFLMAIAIMISDILLKHTATRGVFLAGCFIPLALNAQTPHIAQSLGILVVFGKQVFASAGRLPVRVRIKEEGCECRYCSNQSHTPQRLIIPTDPRLCKTALALMLQYVARAEGPGEQSEAEGPEERDAAVENEVEPRAQVGEIVQYDRDSQARNRRDGDGEEIDKRPRNRIAFLM